MRFKPHVLFLVFGILMMCGTGLGGLIVEIVKVTPEASFSGMTLETDEFRVEFSLTSILNVVQEIDFELSNKSDDVLELVWEKCSYIDPNGRPHRVIHTGIMYIERNREMAPSVIPPGSVLKDIMFPSDMVYFSNGWQRKPLFVLKEGLEFAVLFTVRDSKSEVRYLVEFKVKRKMEERYSKFIFKLGFEDVLVSYFALSGNGLKIFFGEVRQEKGNVEYSGIETAIHLVMDYTGNYGGPSISFVFGKPVISLWDFWYWRTIVGAAVVNLRISQNGESVSTDIWDLNLYTRAEIGLSDGIFGGSLYVGVELEFLVFELKPILMIGIGARVLDFTNIVGQDEVGF